MAEEDESSYGAYYEHLELAGELNPFTILGVAPITALTTADITVAYNQALLHVQYQGSPSLPPTRGPRVLESPTEWDSPYSYCQPIVMRPGF